MEGLVPGEAYMADDDFDDDVDTFGSNNVGSIDFPTSIEKVKNVRQFFHLPIDLRPYSQYLTHLFVT